MDAWGTPSSLLEWHEILDFNEAPFRLVEVTFTPPGYGFSYAFGADEKGEAERAPVMDGVYAIICERHFPPPSFRLSPLPLSPIPSAYETPPLQSTARFEGTPSSVGTPGLDADDSDSDRDVTVSEPKTPSSRGRVNGGSPSSSCEPLGKDCKADRPLCRCIWEPHPTKGSPWGSLTIEDFAPSMSEAARKSFLALEFSLCEKEGFEAIPFSRAGRAFEWKEYWRAPNDPELSKLAKEYLRAHFRACIFARWKGTGPEGAQVHWEAMYDQLEATASGELYGETEYGRSFFG